MSPFDVIVIGRSCLDYIAIVDKFPIENQKVPLDLRLTEGGGQGGTASCCITRLGGKVAYVGRLGDDAEGRFCLQRLIDFNVDTRFVDIVPNGRTPVAYVFVTAAGGQRTIIYERNALPPITLEKWLEELVDQAGVVLLDPEVTFLGGPLKKAAKARAALVYDAERWRPGIEAVMETADFFIPSSAFLDSEQLNCKNLSFEDKIIALSRRIHGQLVVTHGEKGAYYVAGRQLWHVAAPRIRAIDTIGAGDNFHGAFALAVKRGLPLPEAVKFSVAVASLSCRQYGGRRGVPTWDEAVAAAAALSPTTVD